MTKMTQNKIQMLNDHELEQVQGGNIRLDVKPFRHIKQVKSQGSADMPWTPTSDPGGMGSIGLNLPADPRHPQAEGRL